MTWLTHQPYLLLMLTTLFWAGNVVLGRAVSLDVPPIGLAFWRWFGGSLIIIGFAWPHVKRDWPIIRQQWRLMLALSILGITIFNTLLYIALQYTTAINAVLMQSSMPVFVGGATFLLFREVLSWKQVVAIFISIAGVVVIITQGDPSTLLELTFNVGDLIVLIAVFCYACYTSLLQRRPKVHPLSLVAVTFIVGVTFLSPFYAWEHLSGRTMSFNLVTMLAVGYVCIFPSILAYLCYNRGVQLIGANRAGLFIHLVPVFGSLMAVLFLGEQFQRFHTFGILLIASGIVLANR